jgi:hypothetical protein
MGTRRHDGLVSVSNRNTERLIDPYHQYLESQLKKKPSVSQRYDVDTNKDNRMKTGSDLDSMTDIMSRI